MEEEVVHPHRQLSVLLRVHHSEYSCVSVRVPSFAVVAQCSHFIFVQDKEPRGIIPLENLSIKEVEDKKPVRTAPSSGSSVDYPQLETQNCIFDQQLFLK